MTISSIKETVDSALPVGAQSRYPGEYETLLDALNEREYQIVEAVVEGVVRQFGVTPEQVVPRLEALGLSVRPAPEPEPEPEPEAPKSVEERVAAIESAVATLVDSVASLNELANRHLGARR